MLVLAVAILLGNFMVSSSAFASGGGGGDSFFDNTCGTGDWNTGSCWEAVSPYGEFVPGTAGTTPYNATVGHNAVYTAVVDTATAFVTTVNLYYGSTLSINGGTLWMTTYTGGSTTYANVNISGDITGGGGYISNGSYDPDGGTAFYLNGTITADGVDMTIENFAGVQTGGSIKHSLAPLGIPQSPATNAGLYVDNGGSITILPSARVTGDGTYDWGGGSADIANGVTGDFTSVGWFMDSGFANWSGTLYDRDREGNGIPSYTGIVPNLINYYDFGATDFYFDLVTLTFKYDENDPLVDLIGEENLTLWHFDNTSWSAIPTTRDTEANTLTGTITSFSGIGPAGPASVPELPAGSEIPLMVMFGAGILWLRKRLIV